MNVSYLIIHHSATESDVSIEDIRAAHIARGFNDIGYHYLVTASGEIVNGRPESQMGAHAKGINSESLGICCLGNFQQCEPPSAQLSSLVILVSELCTRYSVSPERVIGHRDVRAIYLDATITQCPGAKLYELLGEVRRRVTLIIEGGGSTTSVDFIPGDEGIVTILGRVQRKGLIHMRSSGSSSGSLQVQLTLSRQHSGSVDAVAALSPVECVWENSVDLMGDPSNGDSLIFTSYLPQNCLPPGRYKLSGVPQSSREVVEDGREMCFLAFGISLPMKTQFVFSLPAYRALVVASRVEDTGPFLVRLVGRVVNTGTEDWVNDDELTPFRIGAMIVNASERKAPVTELRYDIARRSIRSGEEIPFSFTFDISEFPTGDYFVHIDVVRERRFWFTELGSKGDTVSFSVRERSPITRATVEHLLNPPSAGATSPEKASFLYIAPTIPLYDRSTGGKRLIELFKMLREEGVSVTFLYQQIGTFTDPQRYLAMLDEIGIRHAIDPLGYLSDEGGRGHHTLCVIGWYSLASSILPAVRTLLPNTKVAIDSVDVHWARELTAINSKVSLLSQEEYLIEKAKEIKVYRDADEVWVVSGSESEIIRSELPSTKTRVIGVPVARESSFVEAPQGDYVLFLGGFSHPPNISAAIWAADLVVEYNRFAPKAVQLKIVGADAPAEILALAELPGVEVCGYVASLVDVYAHARAFIAPLRSGGGVKGKICEAIGFGIPVITNAIGNEGLDLVDEEEILLAESSEDFRQRIGQVFGDELDLQALTARALVALLSRYGRSVIKSQLMSSLIAPKVVIAIVTYNKCDLLQSCVYSVLKKTAYPNFSISVVSNACTDGSLEFLRELEQQYPGKITVYPSDVNHFFVRPNNYIIERSSDADIVLMNNDVEVVNPGWLTNLVDAAYSDSNVCGAGGLVLDSDGNVSEAGAEIYPSGFGVNLFRGASASNPAVNSFSSVGFVSGCLMYMRRDVIKKIGALDDDFHPMYYEDAAWHYKAHQVGLKTVYTPWCVAVHKEGSTAGTDLSKGMKRYQEINRAKFLTKFSQDELEGK